MPSDYGALGYAGVRSLLMAVKAAGDTDTDKVIAALETLKYDVDKGPQSYRACDHQAVQSVLDHRIARSKAMKANEATCSTILAIEPGRRALLRSCDELGHKA